KIFKADEKETEKLLQNGKAIFLKYWNIDEEKTRFSYKKSLLPGSVDSLSGSCIGGNNIGINTFISKDKKRAAADVIQYLTSKDVQKKFVMEGLIYSGIDDLYIEEDVYNNLKSRFSVDVQFISRPIFESKDYDRFSNNFRKYIFEYIYENKTFEEVVSSINDITNIFMVSVDTEYTNAGVYIFHTVMILTVLMVLSLSFLYTYRLKPYLSVFSNTSWIFFVLGSIVLLDSSFVLFGPVTLGKCNMRSILIFVGFYFNFTPILNKFMLMYPKNNKFLVSLCKHRCLYYTLFFVLTIGLQLLGLTFSYTVETVEPLNDKRFQKCVVGEGFVSHFINCFTWIFIFMVILATVAIVLIDFIMIPLGPARVTFVFISSCVSVVTLCIYLMVKDSQNYVTYVTIDLFIGVEEIWNIR
ncbi:hypothetical protein PIROE2DRAFT_61503, partial [Piromyces sp. E2]